MGDSCYLCYAIAAAVVGAIIYGLHKYRKEQKKRAMFERWNNTPKDEVILHAYPRAKTIVTAALFPLKIETYLRLANIKYTMDTKDPVGPKGKSPWISINGNHVTDSEFIMEYLNKKFEKDLNQKVDPVTVANASMVRVFFEEFFMFVVGLERFKYGSPSQFGKVVGQSGIMFSFFIKVFGRGIANRALTQGIGLHSREEVTKLMTKYFRCASVVLGDRKYFGGDEPCQEDAGIFGILAQCLWGLPDSPYEKLLNVELKNLKDYLLRIKETAWPDWDELLVK
jgi:glutathione S-transferase